MLNNAYMMLMLVTLLVSMILSLRPIVCIHEVSLMLLDYVLYLLTIIFFSYDVMLAIYKYYCNNAYFF